MRANRPRRVPPLIAASIAFACLGAIALATVRRRINGVHRPFNNIQTLAADWV